MSSYVDSFSCFYLSLSNIIYFFLFNYNLNIFYGLDIGSREGGVVEEGVEEVEGLSGIGGLRLGLGDGAGAGICYIILIE